jgi:hypothetical protein
MRQFGLQFCTFYATTPFSSPCKCASRRSWGRAALRDLVSPHPQTHWPQHVLAKPSSSGHMIIKVDFTHASSLRVIHNALLPSASLYLIELALCPGCQCAKPDSYAMQPAYRAEFLYSYMYLCYSPHFRLRLADVSGTARVS